jgi:hypothetical protein
MSSPHVPPPEPVLENVPFEYLEELADSQRRNIHNSVSKLRTVTQQTVRERLDLNRNLRQHFAPAAAVAALFGLALGYNLTGMFTRT